MVSKGQLTDNESLGRKLVRKWSKYEYNIYFKVSEKKNKIKMGKQLQCFNAGEKTIFKKNSAKKKGYNKYVEEGGRS